MILFVYFLAVLISNQQFEEDVVAKIERIFERGAYLLYFFYPDDLCSGCPIFFWKFDSESGFSFRYSGSFSLSFLCVNICHSVSGNEQLFENRIFLRLEIFQQSDGLFRLEKSLAGGGFDDYFFILAETFIIITV